MKKSHPFIYVLLVLVSVVWGGSFVVVRVTLNEIPAFDLGFLRFLVATPLMFLLLGIRKKHVRLPVHEVPSLVILGLTGVTFLYIFQYLGVEYTTASTSSVLISTNVVFIAILSAFFLKEVFSFKKVLGVVLSFIGVVVVILSQADNETIVFNELFLTGCIFILLSAFCWAVYSTVGKKLLTRYDPFLITAYAFLLGTIFFLPIAIVDTLSIIQRISLSSWMAVFYLAIVCSVFGYVSWYYALSKIEAGKSAVFLYLIPVSTIIFSSIFIQETPTVFFIAGTILIIYGVYLTQKS